MEKHLLGKQECADKPKCHAFEGNATYIALSPPFEHHTDCLLGFAKIELLNLRKSVTKSQSRDLAPE